MIQWGGGVFSGVGVGKGRIVGVDVGTVVSVGNLATVSKITGDTVDAVGEQAMTHPKIITR